MQTTYSIIVPAYNEEHFLENTLAILKTSFSAFWEECEVIVVDNNSTDKTAEIAKDQGAKVVFEPVNQISRARNTGARMAQGRFLFFVDADTILNVELVEEAAMLLKGGKCCGGGTLVNFNEPNRLVEIPWNLFSSYSKIAAGCFFFCRSDAFFDVGGFSDKLYVGEEVALSIKLQYWGWQNEMSFRILDQHPVVTSNRKFIWYNPIEYAFRLSLIFLFPLSARYRRMCPTWYKRPPTAVHEEKNAKEDQKGRH